MCWYAVKKLLTHSCTRCHTHTPHPLRPTFLFLYTLQHKVLICCRPAGRGGFLVLTETVLWRWRMSTDGPEVCSIWPMQQHWNLLAKFRCCSWHGQISTTFCRMETGSAREICRWSGDVPEICGTRTSDIVECKKCNSKLNLPRHQQQV